MYYPVSRRTRKDVTLDGNDRTLTLRKYPCRTTQTMTVVLHLSSASVEIEGPAGLGYVLDVSNT